MAPKKQPATNSVHGFHKNAVEHGNALQQQLDYLNHPKNKKKLKKLPADVITKFEQFCREFIPLMYNFGEKRLHDNVGKSDPNWKSNVDDFIKRIHSTKSILKAFNATESKYCETCEEIVAGLKALKTDNTALCLFFDSGNCVTETPISVNPINEIDGNYTPGEWQVTVRPKSKKKKQKTTTKHFNIKEKDLAIPLSNQFESGERDKEIFSPQSTITQKDHQISDLQSQLQNMDTMYIGQLHEQEERCNRSLEKKDEQIAKLESQISQMKHNIMTLSHNLAKEMGDKVAGDESSIENISIVNRPMKVADDYNLFCSGAWFDAKTALDEMFHNKKHTDDLKLRFLSRILEVACRETLSAVTETLQSAKTSVVYILNHEQPITQPLDISQLIVKLNEKLKPVTDDEIMESASTKDHATREPVSTKDHVTREPVSTKDHVTKESASTKDYVPREPVSVRDDLSRRLDSVRDDVSRRPDSVRDDVSRRPDSEWTVMNCLGDYLRIVTDQIDFSLFNQHLQTKMKAAIEQKTANDQQRQKKIEREFLKFLDGDAGQRYMSSAVNLTWRMATQRPVMEFVWDGIGDPWNEHTQELHWESKPNTKGAKVQFYIYPGLCHGKRLMVKGKVFVK